VIGAQRSSVDIRRRRSALPARSHPRAHSRVTPIILIHTQWCGCVPSFHSQAVMGGRERLVPADLATQRVSAESKNGPHHHMATGPTIDTARERLQVVLASIASVESAIA
jgi:hypothetical protein